MLNINDFKRGDTRYTDFEGKTALWGTEISVDAEFEDELGKTEETLAAALTAINEKLAFIEKNAETVKDSTVSGAHLDELASDWLYELVENEDGDGDSGDDDIEVELEDGVIVSVNVTPEQFKASLYPRALGFEFGESTATCQAYLELGCDPDYFAGHRIHIEIDEENGIVCEGI
ncbi:MAG: DUF2262 domain-containing protein [Ruminococcus sp.]|nr:DUF2262 domain-containing protein [Ruminococcus sp.]